MQKNQTPATQNPPDADPGFRLPGDAAPQAGVATPPPPETGATRMEVEPVAGAPVTDTSARDLAIGAAVFAVLLVVYFFVRNSYVHHLVVRRVAPSSAGSAGWLMFVGLSFMSAAAVLAMINPGKFLTWAVTAPLVAVGLVALVAALFVGRR
ncbi:MAG: hypothetical protein ACXW2U_18685 [Telluria sp.]